MDKEEIINYVMETPGNSNPAVLGSMLEQYNSGSGSMTPLFVKFTVHPTAAVTSDKTFADIKSAADSGVPIIAGYTTPASEDIFNMIYLKSVASTAIVFEIVNVEQSSIRRLRFTMDTYNNVESKMETYNPGN